ncbi:MAG: Peptidyl-tRNA hydrolase [Microgenomates group bacterium ADurb.Bin219]|nr:MAG: Peptidyl-tRNA hydrolase [Microgenomates group bacterium ADurb.Bin219]HNP89013.1 aminoacyl-tRNA hydrolase [Candidatus Woesebacteria bacterium]
MILIIGLGNPGPKYENSRHNLGFTVLDKLAKELLPLTKTKWQTDRQAEALVLQLSPDVLLAKPQTFMNASGFTVEELTKRYRLDTSRLFIVHDDVDLPLGKIKIRFGGASAGHHGVESIIKELGSDQFFRFRLGIGRPIKVSQEKKGGGKAVENYVLDDFDQNEAGEVKQMVKKTVKALVIALKDGPEKAMNQFNH